MNSLVESLLYRNWRDSPMADGRRDTVDGPRIRYTYNTLQSSARATGNWGHSHTCDEAKATSWKQQHEFGSSAWGDWGEYQRMKCGETECTVVVTDGVVSARAAPIADGLNPNASNPTGLGCLILEAKSSTAEDGYESVYGMEQGSAELEILRRREQQRRTGEIPQRRWGGRISPGRSNAIRENLENLTIMLGSLANEYDTGFLDDLLTDEWSDDRDEYNSIWSLIREKSIMQLMKYEFACCSDKEKYVPYTNYVVIFERAFMEEYFETILTPSGRLARSSRDDGSTWAM